jgi:hypothetical protein
VRGDPVEHPPHDHPGAAFRQVGVEHGCAVGRGEHRVRQVPADLAAVDVHRQDELDIARAVAADPIVDQALAIVGFTVMRHALNQRAGAVANADDGGLDRGHGHPVAWVG